MGDNTCRSSLFCISAFLVVCLSILAQVLIVGLFFVQPFYLDCDYTSYTSPIQSADCLSDSAANIPIILPPNCSASTTLQRKFCYDSGCGMRNMSCPGKRCCCRPIPQVTPVNCDAFSTRDVSYNSSCVYAVCEKTLHSVLLQVYDSSQVNSLNKSGLPELRVQIGNTTETTDSKGIIYLDAIEEGEYPIFIFANNPDYFHASTLKISFYSPSEVVYIVYAKSLSTSVTQIGDCSISSNDNQTLHTTQFNNSISDLLTLPNSFMTNNSFFIPAIVAFSTSPTTANFTVACTQNYTLLFLYSRDGTWSYSPTNSTFVINPGDNSVLWSLSNRALEASYTQYINPNNSTLFLDRGSVLILTQGWFASRVTTDNGTVLAIPVINNTTNLQIRYTSSPYSYLPPKAIAQLGIISTTNLTDNCTSREDNLYDVTPPTSAILSVTNTKLPICYLPHNSKGRLISLTADDSENDSLFLSTLQTNTNYVCLPCPCGFNVTLKGTNVMRKNCPSIGTFNSNARRLLECNMQLRTV